MIDPRTPVMIGVAQHNDRTGASEATRAMTGAIRSALADTALDDDQVQALTERIESIRVVGGIWPYKDPGTLVADQLGLDQVQTTMTPIGGNEVYDLVATTADDIARGDLDLAVICSAETLRTRRADRSAGRSTDYLPEASDAAPDVFYGAEKPMLLDSEQAAGLNSAVAFYAMAETSLRHALGESPAEHLARISKLWAVGSEVASNNPSAWLTDRTGAEAIAEVGDRNRMVNSPYRKLMTSNINVDQAAAVVICSVAAAEAAGVPRDRWIFPHSGAGAADHWEISRRWVLHESPAMELTAKAALELADLDVDRVDLIDLYSCFPVAVQVAQRQLGLDPERPFTITGGLTFFGGPLNSYCLHALARSVELLREAGSGTALLTGNGGFFTKHSAVVVGTEPPAAGFRSERVQDQVDARPARDLPTDLSGRGEIEGYTVSYSHDGQPEAAAIAVLTPSGPRVMARATDAALLADLLEHDLCGRSVELTPGDEVPGVALV